MYITGLGTIGIFGLGKEALSKTVNEKISLTGYKSLDIDLKSLVDKTLFKKLRRADRFTKLAISAVNNAIDDNKNHNIDFENCGIIVSTAYGSHNTTFKFLDELLEYGEKNVSPIKFSNSVHNAAASYISQLFGVRGPVTTISNFIDPVSEAFRLAECWLNSKLCENIIISFVDEKGDIYNKAFDELMKKESYSTEGSCSFIVSSGNENSYAVIEFNEMKELILSLDNISINFSTPNIAVNHGNREIIGDMAIGKAFDIQIEILK